MTRVNMKSLKSAMLGASAVALIGFAPAQAAMLNDANMPDANMPQGRLENAVRAIEQQTNGHVVEIKEHAGMFDAIVASHRNIQPVRLNANNMVTNLTSDMDLRPISRARARDAGHARVDLSSAILKAEETMPGHPVAADFTEIGAITAYNVQLSQSGHLRRVVVDARTGEIIADPQDLPG